MKTTKILPSATLYWRNCSANGLLKGASHGIQRDNRTPFSNVTQPFCVGASDHPDGYIDAAGIAIIGNAVIADKHYIEARTIVLAVSYPALKGEVSSP